MSVKEQIKQEAKDLGIDLIGFAAAKPLAEVQGYLNRRVREGRNTSLECLDLEQRVKPDILLPGVKTIIAAGLAYYQATPPDQAGLRGVVSRSAWGEDYHRVFGRKLEALAQFISEQTGTQCRVFVDTGPPVDRAWAIEAGLGWNGKNCALINPELGSWVFLGSIYSQLELEPDQPMTLACAACDRCLKACPTGALQEGYVINPHRCISYLTQMKGFIPRGYRSLMGSRLYGCDTCQQVCPANSSVPITVNREFIPNPELVGPDLIDLLTLSNRQFKQLFGQSAAAWRGRTVIQRNALIALGNLMNPEAVDPLLRCLGDERAIIRGHAAWALGHIGDSSAVAPLQQALAKEQDSQVQEELILAINKLKGDG